MWAELTTHIEYDRAIDLALAGRMLGDIGHPQPVAIIAAETASGEIASGHQDEARDSRRWLTLPTAAAHEPWDVVYYETADRRYPADEFLDGCPTKVSAQLIAVLDGVPGAATPAPLACSVRSCPLTAA